MIAVDSSTLAAYFDGLAGADTDACNQSLARGELALPPVVLSELLSNPRLAAEAAALLIELPLLIPTEGYWERTGRLRSSVLAAGRKARLADTLIAQSCVDYDVALLTRDSDFASFVRHSKLRLAV